MYSFESYVSAGEAGPDRLMTPLSVVSLMQDCSLLWMQSEPVFTNYFRENNLMMVVTSRQIEFRYFPKYAEKVRVETRIYDFKSLLGYRNTVIYGEDGTIACCCWCVGAWVDIKKGKAVRLPAEILESVLIDKKIEMEYGKRKIRLPECDPIISSEIVGQRSDIDINNHVNNAQYVRMAYNFVPEDFKIKGMRIEYKSQARLGDVLIPYIFEESDERIVVCLRDTDGKDYSVVEFTA